MITASPSTLTVDAVISSDKKLPLTVKLFVTVKSLPTVTLLGKPIVIVLSLTVVSTSPDVPAKFSVSVPTVTTSSEPLSAPIVKDELVVAVETLVILPSAATVITGIALALPYVPPVTPLFAMSTVKVTSAEPSKETLPVASPAKPMSLAVPRLPAVPDTLPVTSPVIPLVELIVVKEPAAGVVPPITAPSIAPPSMSTELLACVAMFPSPRVVRAALASLLSNNDKPVLVIFAVPNVFAEVV